MSKQTIIISGSGLEVAFGGDDIKNVNTIAFGIRGERQEINLTTIDATKYKAKLLADLEKISDIVINKKSEPEDDAGLYSKAIDDTLEITYKIGDDASTKRKATFYAQLKSVANSTLEREPSEGINVDLTFFVTNLDGLDTETKPAITTP